MSRINVNGFDCVALMGMSISTYQLKLLEEMDRTYILMLDGDEAGRKATQSVVKQMEQNGLSFRGVIQSKPFLIAKQLTTKQLKKLDTWIRIQYFWDFGLQILLNPIYWLFKRLQNSWH